MSEGWTCPRCRRGLAPWVSECPCYAEQKTVVVTNTQTPVGGYCDFPCDNKTEDGYCKSTTCINWNKPTTMRWS